jgi:transcription factor TGA
MTSSVRSLLGRDFQPTAAAAAYFGELEEALINGGATAGGIGVDHRHPGGMITSDVQTKCKLLLPPPI